MIVASECPSCGLGQLQMIARKGFRLHLTFPAVDKNSQLLQLLRINIQRLGRHYLYMSPV
ncbi:hypothetical protein Hanom_Chr16g01500731 [Helianthus anomalus]